MMPPARFASWGLFSLILIHWFVINDAIPHGPYADEKARPSALRQWESSQSRKSQTPDIEQRDNEASTLVTPVVSWEDEESNYNVNSNVNVNEVNLNDIGLNLDTLDSRQNEFMTDDDGDNNNYSIDSAEQSNASDNISKVSEHQKLEIPENVTNTESNKTVPAKCEISKRRRGQIHSRSFPRNDSSIDVADVFEVAGEAEAKKTSSIHIGEDITLCWIETTTIKEDPSFDPPKRLVIREFTISFENSATIPEANIECPKLEGEISSGDGKAVCDTFLNEVIDEDTTRSRVVNFTKYSRDGSINIRRHRTVKCATGGVVAKDIYEWPDNTDNPKKRVEIKVGPSMRNVRTGSESEPAVCTSTADASKIQEKLPSSPPPLPNALGSCEDDDCLSISSEETLPTTYKPNAQTDTSDETTKPTATEGSDKTATLTTSPYNLQTAKPFDGPTDRSPTNSPELCAGDDCKVKPAVTVELGPATQKNDICQDGSEACTCIGPLCSSHSNEHLSTPETENKVAEKTTVPSIDASTKKLLNASGCDSTSSECLGFLETLREQNETSTAPSAPSGTEISQYSTNEEKQITPTSSPIGSTMAPTELTATTSMLMSNEISSTPTPPPCIASKSGDCETLIPPRSELIDQSSLKTEYSSTTRTTMPLVAEQEVSDVIGTEPSGLEPSSSCGEDSTSENCQSNGTDDDSELDYDNPTTDVTSGLIDTTLSSAPKKYEHSTKSVDDAVTSTPIVTTDVKTPSTEVGTELPPAIRNTTLPNKDSSSRTDSVTECVFNAEEGSSNCSEAQTATVAGKSCESGNCVSTESTLSSTVSRLQKKNFTIDLKNAGNYSCNDSSDCGTSSDISTENCDGSSAGDDCRINSSDPEPCESSGGSCSLELDSSIELTNNTTTTEPTAREMENFSTTMNNVSTTAETRRSTTTTASQVSRPNKGQHKLALKIKILLEHINEKKERSKLVQLEKHLLLNERSEKNHSLVWKIKSLNNSMNIETLKTIFNCTDLDNVTEEFSRLTEYKQKAEDTMHMGKAEDVGPSLEKSPSNSKTEIRDNEEEGAKKILFRKKREISVPKGHEEGNKNITNTTKVQAIKASVSGFKDDFEKGLGQILDRISHELGGQATIATGKPVEPTSSTILNILANPNAAKAHPQRRKRAIKPQDLVSVQELRFPINGDEIHRWSNERFVRAADGGRVRSLLEFKIMRDASDDSRRTLSGS